MKIMIVAYKGNEKTEIETEEGLFDKVMDYLKYDGYHRFIIEKTN